MTERKDAFARFLALGHSPDVAALAAGYARTTAATQAGRLLKDPAVQRYFHHYQAQIQQSKTMLEVIREALGPKPGRTDASLAASCVREVAAAERQYASLLRKLGKRYNPPKARQKANKNS